MRTACVFLYTTICVIECVSASLASAGVKLAVELYDDMDGNNDHNVVPIHFEFVIVFC